MESSSGEKELGIFGMGRIGRAIAYAREASACASITTTVGGSRPRKKSGHAFIRIARNYVREIDALVIAAPSNDKTRGFLNAESIGWLKRGAIVVNVARGNLIADEDLIAALAEVGCMPPASTYSITSRNSTRVTSTYRTFSCCRILAAPRSKRDDGWRRGSSRACSCGRGVANPPIA